MKNLEFTTKEGYKAYVLFVKDSHYCAHVAIPKNHTCYAKDYDDVLVSVHGGLTYADNTLTDLVKETDELWVFGFDAAHAGDKTAYWDDGVFRNAEYMKAECERLSEQLAELDVSKKKFTVGIYYDVVASVEVSAETAEEAKSMIYKALENEGITELEKNSNFDVTNREYGVM